MTALDVRAIEERELREQPAPAVKHGFRVFLSEEAFDRAVARGTSDTTREVGGVLVGELLRDSAGPYVLVESTVDALHADEKSAELTFTHATWEYINKEIDSQHQGKRVVGWYHTHPGFGVFLSDRDQFIHRSFFDLPFQIALVYDPKSREHGVFTWQDSEIQRTRRYWVGDREQVWDGARTSGEPREPRGAEPEPRKPEAAREPEPVFDGSPGSIAMLAALAVVCLVVGAFAGNWWGASSANQAIAAAQRELVNAKAEGAELAIASLDSELVGVLRQSLADASLSRPVSSAIDQIDGVIATLETQATSDPNAGQVASRLRDARAKLQQLASDRTAATVVLAQLEAAGRRNGKLRTDLAHDVSEQRSGLGALYAELAADVAKAGDKARAKRLLVMAAHLDPGNRARYEQQLQVIDKSAKLPLDVGSGGTR